MSNIPDTVTPPPGMPRIMDQTTFKNDVESIVDARIRLYDDERRRQDNTATRSELKQRAMTYGVGGVIGLVVGAGGTLVLQRLRRRSGAMKP